MTFRPHPYGALVAISIACASPSAPGPDAGGESETTAACTNEACDSTLTVTIHHELDLLAGPYPITLGTPLFDVQCSVPAESAGSDSCFGFRFANLDWDPETITITLIEPFYDTDSNPEATPFETVDLTLSRGTNALLETTLLVDPGDPVQPDPCGPICWPATASATLP